MSVVNILDADVVTRRNVARNQATSPRDLAALADDDDAVVRLFAAINPNTPAGVKTELGLSGTRYHDATIYGVWADDADSGSWDDDEWMYRVGPRDPYDFQKNAVIYNRGGQDTYRDEPRWWGETLKFIKGLDFSLDINAFIDNYMTDSENQRWFELNDDEWRDALIDLYEACKKDGAESLQFKFDAVKALHPDTEFQQVTVEHPYYSSDWVTVFYDAYHMDAVDESDLQTWYFWQVSEARAKYLDFSDLEDADIDETEDMWDLFDDYGDYTDDWALIKDSELDHARRTDHELEFLADALGYNANNCVLL